MPGGDAPRSVGVWRVRRRGYAVRWAWKRLFFFTMRPNQAWGGVSFLAGPKFTSSGSARVFGEAEAPPDGTGVRGASPRGQRSCSSVPPWPRRPLARPLPSLPCLGPFLHAQTEQKRCWRSSSSGRARDGGTAVWAAAPRAELCSSRRPALTSSACSAASLRCHWVRPAGPGPAFLR